VKEEFFGIYLNSIDDKGRCMIPARMRPGLGDQCVIAPGFDENIFIFDMEEYDRFLTKYIRRLPMNKEGGRILQRRYLPCSHPHPIDKQGRVNLPQKFIEDAGIIKDIVTIGVERYIEIWGKERYDAKQSSAAVNISAVVDEMSEYMDEY
jgi:MraZ protein